MNALFDRTTVVPVIMALALALLISFAMTPFVKKLAFKIGAVDVPKDNRRMHKVPIPRLGGLAIYIGCIVSLLLFAEIDRELQGILLGSLIIVAIGMNMLGITRIKTANFIPAVFLPLLTLFFL